MITSRLNALLGATSLCQIATSFWTRLWPLGILVVCTSCFNGEPEIRSYEVAKARASAATGGATQDATTAAEPRRMLGAILPAGRDAWFFKAVGKPEAVQKLAEPFEALMKSFKMADNGEPQWQLPASWRQEAGSGMRFATLFAQSDGEEIPVSVIKLPIFEGTWEAYCESNVNRWRGELSLPNQSWQEIAAYAKAIPGSDAARPGYWFNLEGKQDPSRTMRSPSAPFAGGASAPTPPFASGAPVAGNTPASSAQAEGKPSPLKYKVPEGWKDRGASGMRLLTLWVGDATDPPNEVTIIPASGDLESNVRRWQEQLSPNVDDSTVKSAIEKATKVQVEGIDASVVQLVDSPDQPKQSILAAVIPMDAQSSLFIKYKGDAKTADAERQRFIEFVESVRWK